MAPPKGARKAPVVRPAMPLPHVKRQAAAAAAAAAAKNQTTSQPQSENKGVTSPQHGSPSTIKSNIRQDDSPTTLEPNTLARSSVATANGQRPLAGGKSQPKRRDSDLADHDVVGATLSPLPNEKEMPAVSPKPVSAGPDLEVNGHRSQNNADRTPKPAQPAAPVEATSRQEAHTGHAAKPSASIPAGQPMRQMPPAFQPANRSDSGIGNANNAPRPPIVNGHPHMHKPHHSNASGNLHFGAFHDSTDSSPAPPHSGGFAPPPGMSGHDGRQAWMPPHGHGFPPNMPPHLDMNAANNYDVYGRPDLAYSHMDPYGHYGSNIPPSTPQSFHDSSGSAHPDDVSHSHIMRSTPPPIQPPPQGAGNLVWAEYVRLVREQMMADGRWPQVVDESPKVVSRDERLRSLFGNTELADCTIEMRHRDQRIPPFRFPGHRVVLLESDKLESLIRQQAQQTSPCTLVLQAEDDWVNGNSFYMALQSLYGFGLFEPPMPPGPDRDSENMAVGPAVERFKYAVSYAASGRLLRYEPVVRRGCGIASRFLRHETMEAAFEFSVQEYEDRGTIESLKWGCGSRVLLDALIGTMFNNLPADFTLDPSALGSSYTRLPYDVPSPAQEVQQSSVVMKGNAMGHSRGSLSQGQHIQFGDLSITNGNDSQESQQMSPAVRSAYSRIIVNLPFAYLQILLQTLLLGRRDGEAQARQAIVQDAVKEREARRERAIQAVKEGRVPDTTQIRASLSTVEPSYNGAWTALGWKEEVLFPKGGNGPVLSRQWTPLKNESKAPAADYP